jgi:NSS family neurotransmitter:Na+ symporter
LGNIYQFPFKAGEGGGAAFVILYIILTIVVCFPIMISEIAMGRNTQRNPAGAFRILGTNRWSIVGKAGVLSGVLILSFYILVAGWALNYFVMFATGTFPTGRHFSNLVGSTSDTLIYATIFMIFTAALVSRGIKDGIEKATRILMPIMLIIIVGLIIYAFTLPNAMKGIEFYLIPDFEKIADVRVIHGALAQAFFSLSLGMGAMITYGSYVSKKENILKSTAIIAGADMSIALLAGLMMFPFVFSQGIDPNAGGSLLFQTIPGVFQDMGPVTGQVIGIIFFLFLSFAAFTSTISFLEVPTSFAIDEYGVDRKKAAWFIALIVLIISIPSALSHGGSEFFTTDFVSYFGSDQGYSWMSFIEHIASDTYLPMGGFLIAIFVAFRWKKSGIMDELAIGHPELKKSWLESYLNITLSYVSPIILGILFFITVLNRFFNISVF